MAKCSRGGHRLEHDVGHPAGQRGVGHDQMLDEAGGIQWPFPSDDFGPKETEGRGNGKRQSLPETERRLFSDGRFFHPHGRAQFIFEASRPLPEPACDKFPFLLLTGRGTSAQWHTQTRTAKSAVLRKLYPKNLYVEIHPDDATEFAIESGSEVEIRSRRATITASAFITATVPRGQIFLPMHYDGVNQLTLEVVDPYSRQPAYKACAVAIRRAAAQT